MRAEKLKKYLISVIAFLLMAAVPVTYVRALLGTGGLTNADYMRATPLRSTIVNSAGEVLYNGDCPEDLLYGNLIGDDGHASNTLSEHYEENLGYSGLFPLLGVQSLGEKSLSHVHTTLLSTQAHRQIRDLFGDYRGVCFAYNYKTGEIYMALSLPSQLPYEVELEALPGGSLTNSCFSGEYIPGSIIKVITALVALEQDPQLQNFTHICTGSLELPDGKTIECHSVHGAVDMEKALGVSCNSYMAALIARMDVAQTRQLLAQLGITTDGTRNHDWAQLQAAGVRVDAEGARALADRMTYRLSRTIFDSNTQWDSVWGLVGQGKSQVNPIHMAMLAGAIVNGGETANPYLVETMTRRGDSVVYSAEGGAMAKLIPAEAADKLDEIWHGAVEGYYRSGSNQVVELISHAKTGTAQQGEGNSDRALLGVMEERDTAFCIIVEDLGSGSNLHIRIANALAQLLPGVA